MKRPALPVFSLAVLLALALSPRCQAVLANAWHIPDNTNDLGFHMRNPEFEIGSSSTITVYSGIQKFNNSFGTANQTGGSVYYKGATQGTWSSGNLNFYLNGGPSPNNQYWQASFNTSGFGTNEVIQYCPISALQHFSFCSPISSISKVFKAFQRKQIYCKKTC